MKPFLVLAYQVVSNVNLDWMGQPSASIVVQGVLRPAFIEENSFIKKHLSVGGTGDDEVHHLGKNIKGLTHILVMNMHEF